MCAGCVDAGGSEGVSGWERHDELSRIWEMQYGSVGAGVHAVVDAGVGEGAHLRELVLQESQEEREQPLNRRALSHEFREPHDDRRERRSYVLRRVVAELCDAREYVREHHLLREHRREGG